MKLSEGRTGRIKKLAYNWMPSLGSCPVCNYQWPKKVDVAWVVTLKLGERLETVLVCPVCKTNGKLSGLILRLLLTDCHTFSGELSELA